MNFSKEQLSNIPNVLSAPRFATFLQNCANDKGRALALYQWNLNLSSGFVVPLHIFEISMRNAVVEVLEKVHTQNWPWNRGFIRSLPSPHAPAYSPERDLVSVARVQPTMGKVVAELKFAFWQKIFTARHDQKLWNGHIKTVFPNAPANLSVVQIRTEIHDTIETIRSLRNRIAHHEPIFNRNNQDDYNAILKIVSWRDLETASWMDSIQKVEEILRDRP